MATIITNIPDCDVETNAIQSLVDNPSESGLTANELKRKFDQDATNLKNWINNDSNGLLKHVNDNLNALDTYSSTLNGKIGDLSNLNTTSTDNLVSAINEVNTNMSTNDLLWQGAWDMDSNPLKTITLSSPVSSQKSGIVLVWSYYEASTAQNVNMTLTFIPKKFVELYSGGGVTTTLIGPSATNFASKIVYVTDTTIVGSGSNINHGTNSGITYDNRKYVLRAVIGV